MSGPYDRWPTNSGFDRFYGFIGGETNQWDPTIFDGVTRVPKKDDPVYHFTSDMTNEAIEWMEFQQGSQGSDVRRCKMKKTNFTGKASKWAAVGCVLAFTAVVAPAVKDVSAASKMADKPNVVLMLADNVGWVISAHTAVVR